MKNTNKLKLNFRKKLMRLVKIFGSGGGARTPDLVINRAIYFNCANLSLKDLGRENPLKPAH